MTGLNMMDERIRRASEIAVRRHAGQTRKGDGITPYITHPLRVALYLAEAGLGPDAVAAGLLHDVIEEASPEEREAVRREIREQVGPATLALVEAVTHQNPEANWHDRNDAYLAQLRTAPREALAAACADKADNTLGLIEVINAQGKEGMKRFNSTLGERIDYHEAVADATALRWPDCPILPALREALGCLRDAADGSPTEPRSLEEAYKIRDPRERIRALAKLWTKYLQKSGKGEKDLD